MLDLLLDANRRGYAVPSFCVWNADMVETILRTCERMRSPVILMNGPGEFPLISPAAIAGTVRGVGEQFDVHVAIHLDHGDSIEMVQECIDAGYTSVMLDSPSAHSMKTRTLCRKLWPWPAHWALR